MPNTQLKYSDDEEENERICNLLEQLKTQEGDIQVAIESNESFLRIASLEQRYKSLAKEINSLFSRLGLDEKVKPDHRSELERANKNFAYRAKDDSNIIGVANKSGLLPHITDTSSTYQGESLKLPVSENNELIIGAPESGAFGTSTPVKKQIDDLNQLLFETPKECIDYIKDKLPQEIAPSLVESYLEDEENYKVLYETIHEGFKLPDIYQIVKNKILEFVGQQENLSSTNNETPLFSALDIFQEDPSNIVGARMPGALDMRGLSVKDALDLIPRYNGANIPLTQFLDGCSEAKSILPEGAETEFLKLIRIRLYGEALNIARSQSFATLKELAEFFEKMFGSAKTYYDLTGELAKVKQGRNETVVIYLNRLKEIEKEIRKAAQKEDRIGDEGAFDEGLNKDCLKYFMRGLRWEIKARMGVPENYQKAQEEAIETEREFACSILDEPSDKDKNEEKSKTIKETRSVNIVEPQRLNFTCWYCKKPGHTVARCFALERNKQMWNNASNYNRLRSFVPPRMQQNNPWGWNASNRQRPGFMPQQNNFARGLSPPINAQYTGNFSRTFNRSPPQNSNSSPNNFSRNRNENTNSRVDYGQKNSSLNCYYCGRTGHVQRDCYSYQRATDQAQLRQGNLTNLSPTGAVRGTPTNTRPIVVKNESMAHPTKPSSSSQ